MADAGQLAIASDDRGALLSGCGTYRYRLWRRWADGPKVLFIMLNPSTADANVDDQTIKKCIGFASGWGAGSIDVVNLYAYRATKPHDLRTAVGPVGEFGGWKYGQYVGPFQCNRNDVEIEKAAAEADRVVAAWGSWPGPCGDLRVRRVVEDLLGPHEVVESLKLTKRGHPWHPCYAPYELAPVVYARRTARTTI